MTPPMTPREKVEQIIDDALNSAIPEPWEVANHAADRILTALASSSGDHAELEVVAWRVKHPRHDAHRLCFVPAATDEAEPLVTAASAEALLAENAALRSRENELIAGHAVAVTALERKLAEAERLNDRAADLMRQCTDPERFVGASTLNVYANMRAWLSALSKEAERG